jgi:predicted transcriptional regulator
VPRTKGKTMLTTEWDDRDLNALRVLAKADERSLAFMLRRAVKDFLAFECKRPGSPIAGLYTPVTEPTLRPYLKEDDE